MSKVKTTLKRFSYLRDYKVLENVTVNEHRFDYIMVGVFGILSVCFFDKKGELYGNESDENFILVDTKKNREKAENLIKKAKKDVEVLRALISKEKIYNLKIDSAIVVDDKKCQTFFTSPDLPLVKLSALSKFLNQEKFDLDNKVDADKIVSLLTK